MRWDSHCLWVNFTRMGATGLVVPVLSVGSTLPSFSTVNVKRDNSIGTMTLASFQKNCCPMLQNDDQIIR